MASQCDNFNAILTTTTAENQRWIVPARCKQWTCSYCAQRNRAIWQARIIDHINKNSELQWSWFTLTAHSKKRGEEKSLANLRGAWDALIKRIKRKYSSVDKIHYCRVFEKHKDGSYHLHCIISIHWQDLRIRQSKDGSKVSYSAWLAKSARELKLGYYTHAANFDEQHAGYIAGYVVKYMTKHEAKSDFGRVRHIQTSQGWTNEKPQSEYDWKIWEAYTMTDWIIDEYHKRQVVNLSNKEIVTSDMFLDGKTYPLRE